MIGTRWFLGTFAMVPGTQEKVYCPPRPNVGAVLLCRWICPECRVN